MTDWWDRTIQTVGRIGDQGNLIHLNGVAHFNAKIGEKEYTIPIIHRDSPITGGVSLGANQREAFFVEKNSKALDKLYKEVILRSKENGVFRKNKSMKSVYDTVYYNIEGNIEEVRKLIAEKSSSEDGLISLDEFINRGVGVCRHTAITSAALIEKLVVEGRVRGHPSVDRNNYMGGAHAWARYTSHDRLNLILDVTKGFFGVLEDESVKKAIREGKLWLYTRPEDVYFDRG